MMICAYYSVFWLTTSASTVCFFLLVLSSRVFSVFEKGGMKVIIDDVSVEFVKGATVDYEQVFTCLFAIQLSVYP